MMPSNFTCSFILQIIIIKIDQNCCLEHHLCVFLTFCPEGSESSKVDMQVILPITVKLTIACKKNGLGNWDEGKSEKLNRNK